MSHALMPHALPIRGRTAVTGIHCSTKGRQKVPQHSKQAWDARRAAAATKVAAAFRGMMQRKKWAARDAERVQREA
eukprot:1136721-Pelagomonas_calceolata.AAC.3